jgi:hypothetical protein
MNPLLKKIFGESDDVVPVIAQVPVGVQRKRRMRNDSLGRVLGEAAGSDSIIPDDAQDIDKSSEVVGKPLNKIVNVVQEPSYPKGEKERYITPYSALTAPDCTPEALAPIDPSSVPGSAGPEKFKAADLENASGVPSIGHEHPSVKAMDVLLGRQRNGTSKPPVGQETPVITSEADAARALGIKTQIDEDAEVKAKAFASAAGAPGAPMPEPVINENSAARIASVFRSVMR